MTLISMNIDRITPRKSIFGFMTWKLVCKDVFKNHLILYTIHVWTFLNFFFKTHQIQVSKSSHHKCVNIALLVLDSLRMYQIFSFAKDFNEVNIVKLSSFSSLINREINNMKKDQLIIFSVVQVFGFLLSLLLSSLI